MVDIRSPGVLDSPDALVRLVLAGEEAAFARIVRLYRADMIRVAFVVGGDIELALEAVAATWPVAWNRLADLRDRHRLREWLCTLAAREARGLVRTWSADDERLRAEARGPRASNPREWPAADAKLARLLAPIGAEDRIQLALRYVADLPSSELATATGMSPAAAMARSERLAAARVGPGSTTLGQRLRAYADVPVPHVNIDAVARRARITRHDGRYRAISLAVAVVAAAVVIAVPHLGQQPAIGVTRAISPGSPPADARPQPTPRCVPLVSMLVVCVPR